MADAISGAEPGISSEALYQKVGFKPHSEGQLEYLNSKARFNAPCCGRRWGKSQAAGHRMTYKSFIPDSWNWIVGTSYRIGEKEFRVGMTTKSWIFCDIARRLTVNIRVICISRHRGVRLCLVSADNPDSLLGEGLSRRYHE